MRTILCWERSGNRTATGGFAPLQGVVRMVKTHVQDLASMGRPVRLSTVIAHAWNRMRAAIRPKSPYRVGDAVVGEDPFNGRQEGIVMSHSGTSVELSAAGGVFYYDHRHLRPQD
jgi:hypothetical protein